MNLSKLNFTSIQLRNEDQFDQRQILAAAEASRSYRSTSEKRNDHNYDYIGHWPRARREGHIEGVTFAQERSVKYGNESQRHRDVRRLTTLLEFSLANLHSLVMIAGVKIGSRIWTNIIRKTMTEAF